MNYLDKIIGDIETHDIAGIRDCFAHGVDPNDLYRGEPLIYELTSEYLRSHRFATCVHVFVEYGLQFDNKALLAVLMNDAWELDMILKANTALVHELHSLRCAYTPLHEVTLLHICAEFNHLACATVLVNHHADVNAKAGVDENGFGAQTPIFHTVNQNGNQSFDMLKFLLSKSADLRHEVRGLIWGRGYAWETFIPAVNPISYAMMGLLPQMHRNEITVMQTVKLLVEAANNISFTPGNVPNAYLAKK